jgi:sulfur-carrier protein
MATVAFTQNLRRHVDCPTVEAAGATVAQVLEQVFQGNPRLRGYVLDERGALRRHMVIFVDGEQLRDRALLSDAVRPASSLYVMQALSGG